MTHGFPVRLAASLLALTFFALPAVVAVTGGAQAQSEENSFFADKKKKSDAPLPPAVIVGKAATKTEIVAENNSSPMLTAESGSQLRTLANRYRDIASQGGFPKVPKGSYKKGKESKAVAALNKRLFIEGYLRVEATQGEYASLVTSATIEALSRFQRNMGLAVTGAMDGATLEELNVPAEQRLRTIEANIARLETYGQNLGDRYLVVNVPSQNIETVNNGRVYSRHNAIFGRPERPTPVVMTALSEVNFNPYWNTPASIIRRDLIPKLTNGTQILKDMNIRVFQGFGGPEIDPDTVDWKNADATEYHFRQEPGPKNAMATAKINFPSPFGIYLHDTPEKNLFKSSKRFYSSGCVRVERIDLFLPWVLNGQEGIGSSEIAALAETLERRDVKLASPPQLRVTYLTAWPVGNTVAFRDDIYDLDGSGFIVGQPMPVGETTEDGQRFVLQTKPRNAAAVDAAEAEGIGLVGTRNAKTGAAKKKTPANQTNGLYGDNGVAVDANEAPTARKLTAVESANKKQTANPGLKKPAKAKKDVPGLFDWATYRKEQKLGLKKPAVPAVKKTGKKPSDDKAEVDGAKTLAFKKPTDKKLAGIKPDEKTPAKSVKKLDDKAGKKVAVAEPKLPAKTADKMKKPEAATAPKKVAENCKPGTDGNLPKDCKTPAPKKP